MGYGYLDPLSINPKKWPNTLKQFVGKKPTNCLSVWPFCRVGAWRVKVLNLRIFKKDNIWVDAIREWLKSICEKRSSKIISFTKHWEKRKTLSQEKLSPTSVFPLRHSNNQSWEILAWKNFFLWGHLALLKLTLKRKFYKMVKQTQFVGSGQRIDWWWWLIDGVSVFSNKSKNLCS